MLSELQHQQFLRDGFLVLENAIPEAALAAIDTALSQRLDELAAYLKVDLPNPAASIIDKMMVLERAHPGAALIFTHSSLMSDALFSLWSSDAMLNLIAPILGEDIDGHPFWSVRPKPPEMELFVVPWHQDSAYLKEGAGAQMQVTCWLPLVDATRENGCLELAIGEHTKGHEFKHHSHEHFEHGNHSWYLEIDPSISRNFSTRVCDAKRGSLILFSHLTPHRSLPNLSRSCRWSVDLRYLKAGAMAGTEQQPIAFRRADPAKQAEAEAQKQAYIEKFSSAKRDNWRQNIAQAKWKERWSA